MLQAVFKRKSFSRPLRLPCTSLTKTVRIDGARRRERRMRWLVIGLSLEVAMTPTVAELLARKQQLLQRLHEEPRLNEQDEIARMLAGVNAMLNQFDGALIETRAMRH
jgi:hypothetical protein